MTEPVTDTAGALKAAESLPDPPKPRTQEPKPTVKVSVGFIPMSGIEVPLPLVRCATIPIRTVHARIKQLVELYFGNLFARSDSATGIWATYNADDISWVQTIFVWQQALQILKMKYGNIWMEAQGLAPDRYRSIMRKETTNVHPTYVQAIVDSFQPDDSKIMLPNSHTECLMPVIQVCEGGNVGDEYNAVLGEITAARVQKYTDFMRHLEDRKKESVSVINGFKTVARP